MNALQFVMIFVWVFVVLLLFAIFNTIIVGNVVPELHNVANNSSYVDMTRYEDNQGMALNVFYVVMAIMIIAPFAYLLVTSFFKREPDPYQRGYA